MARIAVRQAPGSAPFILTSQLVEKIKASRDVQDRIQTGYEREMGSQLKNALVQVGNALANTGNISPGIGSGARRIKAKSGGRHRRNMLIQTDPWAALTMPYAKRKPPSTRMWNKRGKLSDFYAGDVLGSVGGASVNVQQRSGGPRSHHEGMLRYRHTISIVSGTNYVIDALVLFPFLTGDENAGGSLQIAGLGQGVKGDSRLMVFPERGPFARPFVARMAAKLGLEAHTAIRKMRFIRNPKRYK